MGYTTDFNGEWSITPKLAPDHLAYLKQFAEVRHVKRDAKKAELLDDPLRVAVGLPIGLEGAYYVSTADKYHSQGRDPSVLDDNEPPGVPDIPPSPDPKNRMANWSQRYTTWEFLKAEAHRLGVAVPGLWCQWVPNEEGTHIAWGGGEKFYEYIGWIEYLIAHFLAPWGYKLNGDVYWDGESSDDKGLISIRNNVVSVKNAVITYR